MRIMNGIFFLLAGLISVVLAAMFVLPNFVNWNRFRPQIAAELSQRLGREVVINGDIVFKVLPAPSLDVSDVRVRNGPGGLDETMLTLAELQARVALAPILSGDVQITHLSLVRPVLTLERFANGATNWQELHWTEGRAGGILDQVRLDRFTVRNGVLRFLDHKTRRARVLGKINADIQADSLFGPMTINGDFDWGGEQYYIKIATGRFEAPRSTPLSVEVRHRDESVKAAFSGLATELDMRNGVSGTFSLEAESVAQLLGDNKDSPLFGEPVNIKAGLAVNGRRIELHNMEALGGGGTFKGGIEIDYALPLISVNLSGDKVNLDSLLGSAPLGESWRSFQPLWQSVQKRWGDLAPEDGAPLSFKLAARSVGSRGSALRDLEFALAMESGRITSLKSSGQLPGSSRFSVTMEENSGQAEIEGVNLHALLNWLSDGPVRQLANTLDGLTAFRIQSRFRLTDDTFTITGAQAKLGDTGFSGGGKWAFDKRDGAFAISVGRFDIDRHGTALLNVFRPFAAGERPLPETITSDFTLAAPDLFLAGARIGKAELDFRLDKGVLHILNASADLPAGIKASAKGQFDLSGGEPKGHSDITLDFASGEDLADLINFTITPQQAETLKKGRLKGTLRLTGDSKHSAQLSVSGTLNKTRLQASASLAPWQDGARAWMDAQAKISSPDAGTLAAQAGLPSALAETGGQKSGRFDLKLAGAPGDMLETELSARLGSASWSFKGQVQQTGGRIVRAAGNLQGSGKKFKTLTASSGFNFAAAPPDSPFDIALSFEQKGRALSWRDLVLKTGGGTMTAEGFYDTRANGLTYIEASLKADFLRADFIFPAAGGDWPSAPLPGTGLRQSEGSITLAADRFAAGAFRLEDMRARIDITPEGFRIDRLRANFAGGQLRGALGMTGQRLPAFTADLSLSGADASQLARMFWQPAPGLSGEFSMSGTFVSEGRSMLALISSLRGKGQAALASGAVEGFDIPLLDKALTHTQTLSQMQKIIARAFAGGQTKFHEAAGGFAIENGLFKLARAAVRADEYESYLTAWLDLPRILLDAEWHFTLPANRDLPDARFVINGALSAPEGRPDTYDLEQGFAGRVIKRGIDKINTAGELPPELLDLLGVEEEPSRPLTP